MLKHGLLWLIDKYSQQLFVVFVKVSWCGL